MKLGINAYTFMWSIGFQAPNPAYPDRVACPAHPLTPLGLLEKAHHLDVRLVQTGPNLPLDRLPDGELERFIRQAQEWNITLELGTRGLDYDHLVKQVALAERIGAGLIRTLPEIDGNYASEGQLILPVVRKVLPVLEKAGIKLGIENGRMPADELSTTLDEIGSPYVGVVLDMVNSLAVAEGWKEVTRKLARHVMCVHYKDFIMRRAWHMMGFTCEGTPSGKGMVDTRWLLEAIKISPYDFNVIIELWPPEQPHLEDTIRLEQQWAEESVHYLRQFIKK
ncbi:MAG: TIM barrel protein [Anaerolineaceae bacterium]|jgi:sugar phosphate isomerase/epimerase